MRRCCPQDCLNLVAALDTCPMLVATGHGLRSRVCHFSLAISLLHVQAVLVHAQRILVVQLHRPFRGHCRCRALRVFVDGLAVRNVPHVVVERRNRQSPPCQ